MPTLLISDLHLSHERNAITALFKSFLKKLNANIEALYILGDLFDVWIGDDVTPKYYHDVITSLRETTGRGIPIYIMHGNRDFLLGQPFAQASGCQFIPDPTLVTLYGTHVLLLHGDTLCTDDHAYQGYRAQVRSPEWQHRFMNMSEQERIDLAHQYRNESRRHSKIKAEYLLDVNEHTVQITLEQHGVTHMIHGHTHRQAVHSVALQHGEGKRYVLGDWHTAGSVLVCDKREWRFEVVQ